MLELRHTIYSDDVIAVALLASDDEREKQLFHLAIKWLKPKTSRDKQGREVQMTNLMGGETDWFVIPYTLAVGVARSLVERRAANPISFNAAGFDAMIAWLVDLEALDDSMCY